MKKTDFLKALADRGYGRDEAAQALTTWRDSGKGFDDDASSSPQSDGPNFVQQSKQPQVQADAGYQFNQGQPVQQPEQPPKVSSVPEQVPVNFQQAIAPRSYGAEPTAKGTAAKTVSDLVSLPMRTINGLAVGAGTLSNDVLDGSSIGRGAVTGSAAGSIFGPVGSVVGGVGGAIIGGVRGALARGVTGKEASERIRQAYEEGKKEMYRTAPAQDAPGFEKFMDPQSPAFTAGMVPYGGVALKGGELIAKEGLIPLARSLFTSKVLPRVVEGATQIAPVTAAQQLDNLSQGKDVSIPEMLGTETLGIGLNAAAPLVGKGIGLAGKGLKSLAKSNVNIEMRPGQWGTKRSYDAENAFKYDLVGKPRDVADKSQAILSDLNTQAKEIGAASPEVVNLPTLVQKLRDKFPQKAYPEDYNKITNFIDNLEESYKSAYTNPDISLPEAMAMRTRIGDKASFVGSPNGGSTVNPDADWQEKIYNAMYGELKNEIHAKAGPELQAINKKQSEIIPIRQVALRRMPIAESNLKASPMDFLAGGIGSTIGALSPGDGGDRTRNALLMGAALAGARRGFGSKAFTELMYNAGNKIVPRVEKALPKLDPANYPSGAPWEDMGMGGVPLVSPKPPIAPEGVPLAPENVPHPGSMSPQDYRAMKAGQTFNSKAGNLEDVPQYPDFNPNELKTPEDFQMDQAYADGYRPEGEGVALSDIQDKFKKNLKLTLFNKSDKEISIADLSPKKQKEIADLAERINTDPDTKKMYTEAGLIGQEDNVHPDDIVQWANEVSGTKRGPNESLTSKFDRIHGNLRDAFSFRNDRAGSIGGSAQNPQPWQRTAQRENGNPLNGPEYTQDMRLFDPGYANAGANRQKLGLSLRDMQTYNNKVADLKQKVGSYQGPASAATEGEGQRIANNLGMQYSGIQEPIPGKLPSTYALRDLKTGSNIAALNEQDAKTAMQLSRDKWAAAKKGQEGSIGGARMDKLGFFSNAENAVDKISMPKAPADQWAKMLDPAKGLGTKADEMKWIGLDDFLKEKGNQTVTKQELKDFIDQNRIELREVKKGGAVSSETNAAIKDALKKEDYLGFDNLGQAKHAIATHPDWVQRWDIQTPELKKAGEAYREEVGGGPTKFEKYQLPGGENYREMLLTLPTKEVGNQKEIMADIYPGKKYSELEPYQQKQVDLYVKEESGKETPKYKSSHWDEPNVLAHVRLNDRVDSEGKKVLFAEELQSDWHQEGRKKGYKIGDLPEGYKVSKLEGEGQGYYVENDKGEAVTPEQNTAELAKGSFLKEKNSSAVPQAPFSKTWHELAFKRILREAAEKGYDKVAWTTGEQQAARYDLSKQIEKITHSKNGDGTYNVHVVDRAENDVYDKTNVPKEDLESLLGKEMAQKIVNREGTTRNRPGIDNDYFTKRGKATGTVKEGHSWYITWEDGSKSGTYPSSESARLEGEQITKDYVTNPPENKPKTLSGLDLKVGGEGMKGFYDKILVDYANKYGKKWGAKVGETEISAKDQHVPTYHLISQENHPSPWVIRDAERNEIGRFRTQASASEELDKLNKTKQTEGTKVHSMDITPAMRKSVMEEGQPIGASPLKMLALTGAVGATGLAGGLTLENMTKKNRDKKQLTIANMR